jgi:hypothetical protein
MSEMLRLLEKRVRWTAIENALVASALFLFGCLLLFLGRRAATLVVVGLLFFWGAWIIAASALRLVPTRASRVFRELSGDARGILWVYLPPLSTSGVKFCFSNATACTLSANKRTAERLLEFVVQRAPHVIVGFGPEQEKAYFELLKRLSSR